MSSGSNPPGANAAREANYKKGLSMFIAQSESKIARVKNALKSLGKMCKISISKGLLENASNIIAGEDSVIESLEQLVSMCANTDKSPKERIRQFCSSRIQTCGGNNQAASKLRTTLMLIFSIGPKSCCS